MQASKIEFAESINISMSYFVVEESMFSMIDLMQEEKMGEM